MASRARWSLVLVLVLLVIEVAGPSSSYAAQLWTALADQPLVTTGATSVVKVTVQNISTGSGGGEAINCVKLAIPSQFTVVSASISSVSRGMNWSASTSGGTVTLHGAASSDRLAGLPYLDTLAAAITVLPVTPGVYSWTANEFAQPDCSLSSSYNSPILIPMTITGSILPTPTPTLNPTSAPTPSPTPALPTLPPLPTLAPTPGPSSAATGEPTSTGGSTPQPSGPVPPSPSGSGAPGGPSSGPSSSPGPDASGVGRITVSGGPRGSGGSGNSIQDVVGGLAAAALARLGLGTLLVPSLSLGIPGLLVILAVLAQTGGGLLWLPLIRRRLGRSGGQRGPRSPRARPASF